MPETVAAPVGRPGPGRRTPLGWIRGRDPGLLVLKRSVRAAVVMPAVFALAHELIGNPQVELFSSFGAFGMLLLVEFRGPARTRLFSYLGLSVAGAVLISIGTVVSTHPAVAVVTMAAVAFVVLFAGIVSPLVASAATASLLTFVLPVCVAQPAGAVGDRLLGWLLAVAFSIPACLLVWPPPWHDRLRGRLADCLSTMTRAAAEKAQGRSDPGAQDAVNDALARLKSEYRGTPYPPTGAAVGAVAVAKLVGRVEWAAGNLASVEPPDDSDEGRPTRQVVGAVAHTLGRCTELVCDATAHPVHDARRVRALQDATRHLDRTIDRALDREVSTLLAEDGEAQEGAAGDGSTDDGAAADGAAADGIAASLDPAFHARALAIATELVADATLEAAGAEVPTDRKHTMPAQGAGPLWTRLASHLSIHSVWCQNALRGATGLALAVAVVELTDVNHGFWVVLGTLSVLRSSATGTGASAVQAVGGTVVGFAVGSVIMIGIGSHSALLWAVLPVAVLLSGAATNVISFAAGQAGFTLVVIILFNIIEPTGWRVGLTRIEDVAIGCAVSIVVGLLFWPRGATAALGRALSDAFTKSSAYLSDAVALLTAPQRPVDMLPAARDAHRAHLRLDDVFRQFLAERGAKVVPVETVAVLFTGTNRLRLAAFTLSTLPPLPSDDEPELESVTVAGAVLRDAYESSHRWYQEFAQLLAEERDELDEPPSHDHIVHEALTRAFDDARRRGRGGRLRTTLRMLWADELLDAQLPVQHDLEESATLFTRRCRQQLLV